MTIPEAHGLVAPDFLDGDLSAFPGEILSHNVPMHVEVDDIVLEEDEFEIAEQVPVLVESQLGARVFDRTILHALDVLVKAIHEPRTLPVRLGGAVERVDVVVPDHPVHATVLLPQVLREVVQEYFSPLSDITFREDLLELDVQQLRQVRWRRTFLILVLETAAQQIRVIEVELSERESCYRQKTQKDLHVARYL